MVANPELPTILEYVNGQLKKLTPEDCHYFRSGDIVWFSFTLTFDFNASSWMPQYKPLDFVRVGNVSITPNSTEEYSVAREIGSSFHSLDSGPVMLSDG